jgi:hypothetical protein
MDIERASEYRLEVIASSAADLVQSAGGWLFDHAIAGWDVSVGVDDGDGARALRILGLTPSPVESALQSMDCRPPTREIAVALEACARYPFVREIVDSALRNGAPGLLFWGDVGAATFDSRFEIVRYWPSAAARAFKIHALDAVGLGQAPSCHAEMFRRGWTAAAADAARARTRHVPGPLSSDGAPLFHSTERLNKFRHVVDSGRC